MLLCPKCQQPMRIVGRCIDVSEIVICHKCLANNKKEKVIKLSEKQDNIV